MSDVRLINGNCLESLRTLEAGSIDAVVTDPPYGIALAVVSQGGRYGRSRPSWEYGVIGDESQEIGIQVLEWAAAKSLPTVAFASPKLPWSGKWSSYLVWDKGGAVGGGGDVRRCWKQTWEMIQVARAGVLNGKRDSAVLRFNVLPQLSKIHPNAKPLSLMCYLIEKLTQPGETILDPFMGSGTTGVACVQTGRKFIGVEIDKNYYEIARKRIEAAQAELPLLALQENAK